MDGVFIENLRADEVDEAASWFGVAARETLKIELLQNRLLEIDSIVSWIKPEAAGELASARGRATGDIIEDAEAGLLAQLVR